MMKFNYFETLSSPVKHVPTQISMLLREKTNRKPCQTIELDLQILLYLFVLNKFYEKQSHNLPKTNSPTSKYFS